MRPADIWTASPTPAATGGGVSSVVSQSGSVGVHLDGFANVVGGVLVWLRRVLAAVWVPAPSWPRLGAPRPRLPRPHHPRRPLTFKARISVLRARRWSKSGQNHTDGVGPRSIPTSIRWCWTAPDTRDGTRFVCAICPNSHRILGTSTSAPRLVGEGGHASSPGSFWPASGRALCHRTSSATV